MNRATQIFSILFILYSSILYGQNSSGKYLTGIIEADTTKPILVVLKSVRFQLEATIAERNGNYSIPICSDHFNDTLTLIVYSSEYSVDTTHFVFKDSPIINISLTKNGQSLTETNFKLECNKAYKVCLLRDIDQDKTYINCVGEIRKGYEIKLYSYLNWTELRDYELLQKIDDEN